MANMLDNYFTEIGQKLAANIKLPNSANIRSLGLLKGALLSIISQ